MLLFLRCTCGAPAPSEGDCGAGNFPCVRVQRKLAPALLPDSVSSSKARGRRKTHDLRFPWRAMPLPTGCIRPRQKNQSWEKSKTIKIKATAYHPTDERRRPRV
ncbi:uncharacterized protein Tco025E_03350, partial [Trypanosoma conorhini]